MRAIYAGGYEGKNPTRRYPSETDRVELINLYHLARVPGNVSRYDRIVWAVAQFVKGHPDWTKASAYKSLDEALRNPTLVMPIKSKSQMEHLFKAQSHLTKAGVTFDTGTNIKPMQRHWELDWSLKGAKMKNPNKKWHEKQVKLHSQEIQDYPRGSATSDYFKAQLNQELYALSTYRKKSKRNPGKIEKTGNVLGGLGIMTIPLFIGLIVWLKGKAK